MKNTFNLRRTIISLLMLSLTLLAGISCKFNQKAAEDSVLVSFNSVLPEEYRSSSNSLQSEKTISSDRSAIPEFSNDTLLYDVTASYTENGTTKTITRTGCSNEFTLPLIPEKTYTVTVNAYDSSDASKATIFRGQITNISVDSLISDGNGPFTIYLQLYKDASGNFTAGNGSINLPFIVDYENNSSIYQCDWSLSGNTLTSPMTGSLAGSNLPRNQTKYITLNNIPSNSKPYDLFVTFKYGSTIAYQFHSDVLIFAGTETNTWKNEMELGSGTNSSTIVITQALVDSYTAKYFYVRNDSQTTNNSDGQGTYESPWYGLQNAIDKILTINNGSTKYTIYVLGNLSGSYAVTDSISQEQTNHNPGKIVCNIPATNTKDLDILIQGIGTTKTLNSDSTAAEVSVTNSSNKNVSFEFVNLSCAHKIETSGVNLKLNHITSPAVSLTNTNATFIGLTSTPAPATGYNVTLDSDCTIKIGGKTGNTNNIGKLYLPNDGDGNQIKFQILNTDSDNSPLTLDGSSITFASQTVPNATTQYVLFTDGFSAATNTSELASEIFTNVDSFVIGQVEVSGSTSSANEACIAISSGSITINYLDDITFLIDKDSVESKALNATESSDGAGSSFTIPSGYSDNPRTITVSAQKDGEDINISNISSLSVKLISTQVSGNNVIATSSTNTITVPYGLPEGQYIVRVLGFYNDGVSTAGYSSDFTVSITDNVQFAASKTMLLKGGTTEEKTLSIFGNYLTNNLTIGVLDTTSSTSPFTITQNANGSASVLLSADSPTCGSNTVNVYGYTNAGVYFRDSIPITIGEFIVEFKKNTTVQTGTIYIDPDETGNNRKIKINANLHISDSTADDISLNSTAEVHVVRVTGSGANENEEELYIYDDVTIASNEIVYTVPAELPIGFYRIYITFESEGITKTIIRNLNISSAGFPVILGGTFNSSTTLSDSSVFIANRNLTIPQLIASDHEVTQGEYEQFMTYISSFAPAASLGLGSDYPAYFVSWYEAIIYCNLKSIADNLTPAYYLVNSSGEEIGGTGNGRNPSTWLNTTTSGTNIAVSNGKYYYNSTTAPSSVLNYNGDTDTDGGIRFDQNANGWRLPTDVEWEYLARGGNLTSTDQTTYSGSNTINEVAWYSENSGTNGGNYNDDGKAHEVKTKLPNSLGLYDMSGNVYEWCWDWQLNVSDNIDINTPYTGITSGTNRVLRGGAWGSSDTLCAISYRRSDNQTYTRNRQVGFRVVRTLSE